MNWHLLGDITHLQVQQQRLVSGVRPHRTYDPSPLAEVEQLALTSDGILGLIDGGWVLAVHHRHHPKNGRYEPERALSVGFTSHYEEMAQHFGSAKRGIAGENVIVATGGRVAPVAIEGGLRIDTAGGSVVLADVAIAEPCMPFTRFMLGRPDAPLEEVEPHRAFLRQGTRGYVVGLAGISEPLIISVGDKVWATGTPS